MCVFTCLYAYCLLPLYQISFLSCYCLLFVKSFYVLEFNNCVVSIDKNENKNLTFDCY